MRTMIVGIIMIVIALLMFGIVLDAVTVLMDEDLSAFTGLEQLVGIAPMLIFIGLLAGGGWLTFKGITGEREGKGGRRLH